MSRTGCFLILGLSLMVNLEAHVELVHPEGGETFQPGELVNVEWEQVVAHNTLDWDLFFSTDGGISWNILKADIPVETLSYQWTVPELPTGQARIKVVQDNELDDYESISPNFTISGATGISASSRSVPMEMYPNPMLDYTTVEFENPLHILYELSVMDSRGSLVRQVRDVRSGRVKIERGDLPAGLYFILLREENEIHAVRKLVLE